MPETPERRFNVLLVDDEPNVLASLKRIFRKSPFVIHCAENGFQAIDIIKSKPIDFAIIDLMMPQMDGMTLLQAIREQWPAIRVMILTGVGGVQEAVKAIQMGAVDFVQKPFENETIEARISHFFEIWTLEQENRRLKEQVGPQFTYDRLIGNSSAILNLKKVILQICQVDASVLIQGETGTGKELVARAIHHQSPRAKQPFVPVDCAAFSETVMGSELFGHVKGAFTGAHESTLGLIRSADRGILFLDEVGELPLTMQAKLLRTIQEKEVRPVGSSRSFDVDVQILAATNRNLEEEVAEGRFRQDLYYRLNVVVLQVPPLRDRLEDIPLIVRHFIGQHNAANNQQNSLSKEALACLNSYEWPGNVRELENIIRRALAIGKGQAIEPDDLPESILPEDFTRQAGNHVFHGDTLEAYEVEALRNALVKCEGHRKNAARMLGIGEATLYRKIAKYQLES